MGSPDRKRRETEGRERACFAHTDFGGPQIPQKHIREL